VRSGKWSNEEEDFANRLVLEFEKGWLKDCEDGCTLRSFLARRLNCAPMRISKKFAGRCIGKLVFARAASPPPHSEQNVLDDLEQIYRISVEREYQDSKLPQSDSDESQESLNDLCGNDSCGDLTDEQDQDSSGDQESILIRTSSSLAGDDADIFSFDFFDTMPLYNENFFNSAEAETFVHPHEWHELLSFFSDDAVMNFDSIMPIQIQ